MPSHLDRRQFLRLTAAAAVFGPNLTLAPRARAADSVVDLIADPGALYRRIIPARKGLPAGWVRSLVVRDAPEDAPIVCRDQAHLGHIGMTVGGIGCGSVYLSGDGQLYVWDIFNRHNEGIVPGTVPIPEGMENIQGAGSRVRERDGANYVRPPTPETVPLPFRQGFELVVAGTARSLDTSGWASVSFRGDWPVGRVTFEDPASPVGVRLAAWTPFIPLNVDDSALPVTVMEYELENRGDETVEVGLRGILENPVLCHTRQQSTVALRSRIERDRGITLLIHEPAPADPAEVPAPDARPDVVFEDFERADYGTWTVEGTAFGAGPVPLREVPDYQGDLGAHGRRAVNSHASAPGASVGEKDNATGTLTSPEFVVSRRYLTLLIGGGNRPGETGVDLLVEGEAVASLTGRNHNRMARAVINTQAYEGKTARLRIYDRASGGWGNIGVDHIVFTDTLPPPDGSREELGDYGTMVLACLNLSAAPGSVDAAEAPDTLQVDLTLAPGESRRVTFLLAWHFPNLSPLPGLGRRRPAYAARFDDAAAVARDTLARLDALRRATFAWTETWYDASLPRWLMDRSILTANTLQTSTCYLLDDGRFWAWEGIGCCPGTCNHVWHYAQSVARLFPQLERTLREVTDFGIALNPDGGIRYRGDSSGNHIAIDGQAGVILRTWREHLCSPDDAFLRRVWPAAKQALEWLVRFDENDRDGLDGLLDGNQPNTLDASWFGKVHCLCSLYLAALKAGQALALEAGDAAFAARCGAIHAQGAHGIERLFNGEFYVQIEDPAHRGAIGVGQGCYIDQVIGQWWATQTGLGRLYREAHIHSALHALWKYNFVPETGRFRRTFVTGRFYALGDEAGLIMCSWPNGGLREDFMRHWQYGYFNECMTGFEYQAAGHMIMEGAPVRDTDGQLEVAIEDPMDPRSLTLRGLAIGRAIHDRYSPARRNPYNEIECSDHYARAAAGFSLFTAATGFDYHGPKGELGFAPKLTPERFHAPFIAAEGWGSFRQRIEGDRFTAVLSVRHGSLRLASLRLVPGRPPSRVSARLDNRQWTPPMEIVNSTVALRFDPPLVLSAGQQLDLELG